MDSIVRDRVTLCRIVTCGVDGGFGLHSFLGFGFMIYYKNQEYVTKSNTIKNLITNRKVRIKQSE